jgi:hypothetical protein
VGVINGEVKEEITGARYFELAGSKYVLFPSSEEMEVLLTGEEAGRYSLTVEELNADNEQTLVQEILGATSTPGMSVGFSCQSAICSSAEVDYDADGQPEAIFDWDGSYSDLNPAAAQEPEVTESRSSVTTGTRVRPPSQPPGQVAGITTNITDEDLQRMWAQVMEIKDMVDRLKLLIQGK